MNTAYNIDCMKFMRTLPDKAYDLAIADPPYFKAAAKPGFYGAPYSKIGAVRWHEKTAHWDIPQQAFYDELCRVSKAQIIWGINYFQFVGLGSGRIVWDKCNDSSTFSDCEIAYCSKIDSVRIFRFMWNGMLQGKSISEGTVSRGNRRLHEKRIHPTQKPVELYKWLLLNYAQDGDSIFDPYLGSGSSRIACYDMGFNFTGCEIDKKFFALEEERFVLYAAQQTFDF